MPRSWWAWGCVVVIMAASLLSWWAIHEASSEIRRAATGLIRQTEEIKAKVTEMIESSWQSGGINHTVRSTQKTDETWSEFVDRHDAEVNEALKKWPKDT